MSSANSEHAAQAPTQQDAESSKNTKANGSMITSLFAGITASACCAGPLILLTLGISGSWIGNLSKLEPFRPLFIGVALIFIGLAYRKLYWLPKTCAVDARCATPAGDRNQKIIFWVVTVIVLVSITFPWYGPLLLDD